VQSRNLGACLIGAGLLSAILSAPRPALAQPTVSLLLESDYRYRGLSLTNGEPAARLGLAFDHRSGAYGGGSLVVGKDGRGDPAVVGYGGYAGYARRTGSGLVWDVGVTGSRIETHIPVRIELVGPDGRAYAQTYRYSYRARYLEAYAGASKGPLAAYVYYSPDYLQDGRTLYFDLTATARPRDDIRLFGHVGALAPLEDRPWPSGGRGRFDYRLGVAWQFPHGELQLAWTGVASHVDYPIGYPQRRDAVVLSAAAFF